MVVASGVIWTVEGTLAVPELLVSCRASLLSPYEVTVEVIVWVC